MNIPSKCVPCEGGVEPLTKDEAGKLLEQVPGWIVSDDAKSISRRYSFKNFLNDDLMLRSSFVFEPAFDFCCALVADVSRHPCIVPRLRMLVEGGFLGTSDDGLRFWLGRLNGLDLAVE